MLLVAVAIDLFLEHLFKAHCLFVFCVDLGVYIVPTCDAFASVVVTNMGTVTHPSAAHLLALLLVRATLIEIHLCDRTEHTDEAVICIFMSAAEADRVSTVALKALKDGLCVMCAITTLTLSLSLCTSTAPTVALVA